MDKCKLCLGISAMAKRLGDDGFVLSGPKHEYTGCSFSIDNTHFVGGISFWPESTFEFQFIRLSNNEEFIETHDFTDVDSLVIALDELLFTRLK